MLTLEEAIKKYKRDEKVYRIMAHHNNSSYVPKKIADEYKQLAEWLRELQERRKAPEIVRCGECVNFAERDFCKVAGHNVHRKSNCMKVFGAERRTE